MFNFIYDVCNSPLMFIIVTIILIIVFIDLIHSFIKQGKHSPLDEYLHLNSILYSLGYNCDFYYCLYYDNDLDVPDHLVTYSDFISHLDDIGKNLYLYCIYHYDPELIDSEFSIIPRLQIYGFETLEDLNRLKADLYS